MNCNCSCGHILRVPYGNPFRIAICRSNVAPGNPDNITFADIDDLRVQITRIMRNKTVQHEVMDNGDLLIDMPVSAQSRTTYGILMTGTYQGLPWRWKASKVFSIVDKNADSSMEGLESFGIETYYIGDTLDVDVDDDMMIFITHAHADLTEDGALVLQDTDDMEVTIEGDTLVFTTKD